MSRIFTIAQIIDSKAFSLSVGAGQTRLANVNVDVSRSRGIDVLCSATHMPFRNQVFQEIIFTDVIEHIPRGSEEYTIAELARVLAKGCRILITTPNNRILFNLLDPAWWLTHHRHYKVNQMKRIVKSASLKFESWGTFGDLKESCRVLFMYFTFPIKRITGFYPKLFFGENNLVDPIRVDNMGLTLFVIARK